MGVHVIRVIEFWGLYWDFPVLGNYYFSAGVTEG